MPRYIDADELWIQIDKRESFEQGRNRAYYKGLRDAKKILCEQPTANVVEPKRGKWEMKWHEIFHTELPRCTACKKFVVYKTNFCPHCGADMRGEKDAENH